MFLPMFAICLIVSIVAMIKTQNEATINTHTHQPSEIDKAAKGLFLNVF